VRFLIYIVIGAATALAVIALAIVLLDDGEQQTVAPQTEIGQTQTGQTQTGAAAVATATTPDNADTATAEKGADTGDGQPATGAEGLAGSAAEVALEIDLAQVRPDGNAVFAGRAQPNARVTVFEGDVVLGTTVANDAGEWVIIPEKALGAGEHLVSVGAESDDGTTEVAEVTLAIRVGESSEEQPLVALLPQSETDIPQLLQSPDDAPLPARQRAADAVSQADAAETEETEGVAGDPSMPAAGPAIAPRALSWKQDGALVVSGVSRGGTTVSAVSAGASFGEAAVDADGAWQIAGQVDLGRDSRVMRFALKDAAGSTVATYELPVATRDLSKGLDGSRMVIVQKGDALWRIAYRSYGEGVKYVDIVRRNATAIVDPDLIFPNQIFAIPK